MIRGSIDIDLSRFFNYPNIRAATCQLETQKASQCGRNRIDSQILTCLALIKGALGLEDLVNRIFYSGPSQKI